jgi:hypothetical protein
VTPDDAARRIFHDAGALLENHHSGDHGSGWIDKDVVYPRPRDIVRLSELLEYRYLATLRIPAWSAATCARCGTAYRPIRALRTPPNSLAPARPTSRPKAESAAGPRS